MKLLPILLLLSTTISAQSLEVYFGEDGGTCKIEMSYVSEDTTLHRVFPMIVPDKSYRYAMNKIRLFVFHNKVSSVSMFGQDYQVHYMPYQGAMVGDQTLRAVLDTYLPLKFTF